MQTYCPICDSERDPCSEHTDPVSYHLSHCPVPPIKATKWIDSFAALGAAVTVVSIALEIFRKLTEREDNGR